MSCPLPAGAAAAGCGEAAAEVESPAVLGPPFLNLIRGTCGLTVTNLRRTLRLAETEDIVDGSEVNFVKSAAAPGTQLTVESRAQNMLQKKINNKEYRLVPPSNWSLFSSYQHNDEDTACSAATRT